MKKITFLLTMIFVVSLGYAQQSAFTDDFTDETYPGWTFYDEDGDGNFWGDLNQIGDGDGGFITPPSLISRSWQGSPLTPDNWAVSPAIDLSSASGTITVDYITQVAAQAWDQETYSVYVTTTDDFTTIQAETPIFTTTLGDGAGGIPQETHTHDISSFAGESEVYITFRHFNTTDMDFIAIHELNVFVETLSNNEFVVENDFVHFIDNNKLNIQASTQFNEIQIFDISGKQIINNELNGTTEAQIDINTLNTGVYIAKINTENGLYSFKFAK